MTTVSSIGTTRSANATSEETIDGVTGASHQGKARRTDEKTKQFSMGVPLGASSSDLLSLGGALFGANVHSRAGSDSAAHVAPNDHPSLRGLKRTLDVVVAVLALLLALPLLAACAVAIRLTSKGPIFFFQSRAGRGGQAFSIVKFRTMMVDAEAALAKYLEAHPAAREEWKTTQKLRVDPRITPVGRIMRKLSLDELPQLWNVVKGEMSLVGPRPIPLYEIPVYGDGYVDYCRVRPGLTGLWQVSGRSNTGYTQRVELDCHYVRRWSVKQDLEIIARTLPAVVRSAGAY